MYYYLANSNRSQQVSNAIKFETSKKATHIALSKHRNLLIYNLTTDGLQEIANKEFSKPICSLHYLHIILEDIIVIITTDLEVYLLKFTNNTITVAFHKSLKEPIGRMLDKPITYVDYMHEYLVILAYEGIVKVCPFDLNEQYGLKQPFILKFKFSNIIYIAQTNVLSKNSNNAICLLYKLDEANYIAAYGFSISTEELDTPIMKMELPEGLYYSISMISLDTAVIFGCSQIIVKQMLSPTCSVIPLTTVAPIISFNVIDYNRVLFGTEANELLLLNTRVRNKETITFLGKASYPTCLLYIDNNIMFVGSTTHPSQLLNILKTPTKSEKMPFLEVIREYDNLSPIHDMCVVGNSLFTLSGANTSGSINKITKGKALEEICTIPILGVIKHWVLNIDGKCSIAFTTTYYSDILTISDNTLHRGKSLLIERAETYYIKEITNGYVQIADQIAVYNGKNYIKTYPSSANKFAVQDDKIYACFKNQCKIWPISWFTSNEPKTEKEITVESEISAIECYKEYIVISCWEGNKLHLFNSTLSNKLLTIDSMDICCSSIVMYSIEENNHIMCGGIDGKILLYTLNQKNSLVSTEKICMGQEEINLCVSNINGNTCVIASGESPSIITHAYSDLQISQIKSVPTCHISMMNGSFVMSTLNSIQISKLLKEECTLLTSSKVVGISVTKLKLIDSNYIVVLGDNQENSCSLFTGYVMLFSVYHLKKESQCKLNKMEQPMDVDIYYSALQKKVCI